MRYDARCDNCGSVEIDKPMTAQFPKRHSCGGMLTRLYSAAPAVHYTSSGFYSFDVTRFRNQVGPERFARFEAQRDDALARARAGKLTDYELALEGN